MTHPRHAALLVCALAAVAPAADPATRGAIDDSAVRQSQLIRAFESFRQKLTVLAGRLEVSPDGKDRDRAKALRQALTLAGERGTGRKFESLLRSLTARGAHLDIDLLSKAGREVKEVREDLKKLLALLTDDGRDAALKQRQQELKELLDRLKALRANEARLMVRTEMKRGDNKELMKTQDGLKEETIDVTKQEKTPDKARKPLHSAQGKMGRASGKLAKGDSPGAGESQAGAIADLDQAINAVEEGLTQTQQEQRDRKLRDLLARVKRMHAFQEDILAAAVGLTADLARSDAKPTLALAARANKVADQQLTSLREADGALTLLRGDATGVAFIEVLGQVGLDMELLKRRLDAVDVGPVTTKVAEDVVETLAEVIKALEKAIQAPPPPTGGGGGYGGTGREPPLVNRLQQLKMIFAMQRQVNARTALYGKHYAGEQAPAAVRKELNDLARRQEGIGAVTREVGKQGETRID